MSPTRRPKGDGTLFKRSDGMWMGSLDIATEDGKRRRKTVSSRDYNTALTKLRKLRKDIDAGQVATTGNTTVAKWLEHWLDTIQGPHIRPTTHRYYELTIRAYINPHIGTKRLDRLTPEDVRRMHRAVQKSSTRNAQKAQQVLQRALKDAEAEGMVARNVAAAVRKPKHASTEKGTLSLAVARHILNTAERHGDVLAARWAVAFWTGARQGELLGLTWDRVDLDVGKIRLEWQLQQLSKKHGCGGTCGRTRPGWCPQAVWDKPPGFEMRDCHRSLVWTRPKSAAGTRVVPIEAPVVEMLTTLKARDGSNPHNLVWHHSDGRPYSPTDDAGRWKKLLELSGVEHVGVHVIRHSTATILQAAGVDEMTRMKLMGHSSAASQQGYIHIDDTSTRAGLQVFNELHA